MTDHDADHDRDADNPAADADIGTTADAALYADRDAINPRAFAVRHLIIQDVKFRKPGADPALRARLDRVARGADVAYESSTHELVVRFDGAELRRTALDALPLYTRGDGATPKQRVGSDVRHWDEALEQNRVLASTLVDAMLQRVAEPSA